MFKKYVRQKITKLIEFPINNHARTISLQKQLIQTFNYMDLSLIGKYFITQKDSKIFYLSLITVSSDTKFLFLRKLIKYVFHVVTTI